MDDKMREIALEVYREEREKIAKIHREQVKAALAAKEKWERSCNVGLCVIAFALVAAALFIKGCS